MTVTTAFLGIVSDTRTLKQPSEFSMEVVSVVCFRQLRVSRLVCAYVVRRGERLTQDLGIRDLADVVPCIAR